MTARSHRPTNGNLKHGIICGNSLTEIVSGSSFLASWKFRMRMSISIGSLTGLFAI
jgi:hypothetical protein